MSDGFYRAFEEKHRGSRELILSRLHVYRPFVLPLIGVYPASSAVDLGCGRGEWLEFLMGEGFAPLGVDQDEGMLQGCVDRGLPAEQGDAITYISGLPDNSQSIVSAFHVVEHISFDQLRTLVSEALRVLKPGGLLIMETPNPENIAVATRNFYLDPTHVRPIPPQLLEFIPEYYGYARAKVVRIQESKELASTASPMLSDVFEGVSPDYAVVAQKAAPAAILGAFDQVFDQDYGLPLSTLSGRYDAAIDVKVHQAESQALQADEKAQQALVGYQQVELRVSQAEARVQQAEFVAHQANAQSELAIAQCRQAEDRARHAESALAAMHQSTSWRITAPIRWVGFQLQLLRTHGIKARGRAGVRKFVVPVLHKTVAFVSARPELRTRLVAVSKKTGTYDALRQAIYRLQRTSAASHRPMARGVNEQLPFAQQQLTPRGRKIYAGIKAAMERNVEHG